jgi:hypothetical protein
MPYCVAQHATPWEMRGQRSSRRENRLKRLVLVCEQVLESVRNDHILLTMKMKLAQQILAHASTLPEGAPLTAKGFLQLGHRATIDQTLSRLFRSGKLLRSGRGFYVLPVESRFGTRAPAPEKVVAESAKLRGEVVASHGAAAANRLGLTTQVPMRTTYLTSGPSRELKLGAQCIELKHVPHWQLMNATRESGEVVRALAWTGRSQAREVLARLKPKLTSEVREELIASRSSLPGWLAETISLELAA